MKNKKILIAGGTGFIGSYLTSWFGRENKIVILTRNAKNSTNNAFKKIPIDENVKKNVQLIEWNGKDSGDWCEETEGCDIILNLAGKSVNCRYNEKNKREIFDSRTNATKAIGEAIRNSIVPPKLWINAASATIYRHATDRSQDEYAGEYHDDFSVQVCKLWEKTFFEQRTPFTRKIALRMAITLANGGVIIPFLNLCKFGLGGRQGNGKQMFSWVHAEDVCRAIEFLWDQKELEGVFNVSSPNPVNNEIFMSALRKITGNRIGLAASKWMLQIGALLLGTETELLLKSHWVSPTKLIENGFTFKHTYINEAIEDIVSKLPRKTYHLL